MDVKVFEPQELLPVLRALRDVAFANLELSTAEADFIEGVARLHGQRVVARELLPISPLELAQVLVDPQKRKRAVQLAIVTSLIEGEAEQRGSQAVRELAQALEVPEAGLSVLSRVAEGRAMLARFDVLRRMRHFVERSTGRGMFSLALPALLGLNEDETVAARYWALGKLPSGSLGRALYDHYREHGFALPGEKHGVPEEMLFHDVGHVFSGYGVDPQGEIQQAAFQAGFVRTDGFLFLLFGILQFHLGLRITPIAEAEHGYFDVKKVLRAVERGAACRVDFSDGFDFFAHAEQPLSELRERFGIPPL
jgi:tellurite resistance protein